MRLVGALGVALAGLSARACRLSDRLPVRTTGNLVNCPVVGFTNE
jgi:hypothetical protein